jgi:hypothetical protein
MHFRVVHVNWVRNIYVVPTTRKGMHNAQARYTFPRKAHVKYCHQKKNNEQNYNNYYI